MNIIEFLYSALMGIVEGITEWLPISSTGHMILFDKLFTVEMSESFREMFLVVIQLGAILAVIAMFFRRLNPFAPSKSPSEKKSTWILWSKVIVGMIPAGVAGVVMKKAFGGIPDDPYLIAATLFVYGVAFIVIERIHRAKNKQYRIQSVESLSYVDAIIIGLFQALSVIPGTSRSGSTIIGGMLTGVSRTAAAEFTFFMAIPVMAGASLVEVLGFIKDGVTIATSEIYILAVGTLVSFLVSLVVIKFLMSFVKKHSFEVFGWYRVVLAAVVVLWFALV